MNIIAADDEELALEDLIVCIKEVEPSANIYGFKKPSEVLEFVKNNYCEVAFLDIEFKGMNGVTLSKLLKKYIPNINIIFVTGYSEYMNEAFLLRASGYILKPLTKEAVEKELKDLRNPI